MSVATVSDDPHLVSSALVPALRLAEAAGMHSLLDQWLREDLPNPIANARSVIGGMLAGADCIDDMDLLRHGGTGWLFTGVRRPSTLGAYLRSFTDGHVQQLDAVGGRLLVGLAARVPDLLAGLRWIRAQSPCWIPKLTGSQKSRGLFHQERH